MSLNSNSILTSEVATQAVNNGLHMFSDDFFSAGGMRLHQMIRTFLFSGSRTLLYCTNTKM